LLNDGLQPGLIILDLGIPRLDGYAVLARMRNSLRRSWRILPAFLAFGSLAIQIALPWTVPHFVTQDGPSYLYNAVVARKLLFHAQPYASLYSINSHIVPSWASTILFSLSASLVGAGHAEQLLMSLILCLGFFSFSYAIRALSPKAAPFTPLSNALLETWFLWMGFYNFYFGMALVPLGIGFYARRDGKLTIRAAAILSVGLVILFFTHLLAAGIAVLALAILGVWLNLVRPKLQHYSDGSRDGARQAGILLGAMAPVILLCLIYARAANGGISFRPEFLESWFHFPMHVFATANGFAGGQWYLWPAVLGLIIIAVLGMRRSEWRTAKGGLAIAVMAVFLLYLIVPDSGLGGTQVKVRFAWIVFLLGGLLVSSVARLQPLKTPIAIFVSACLAFNLASTAHSVATHSKAVADYLSTLTGIRPGSTIIRLRYPTPDLAERYRFHEIGRDPLFHLDAYAAARLGYIDLSDYQAPSADFPVIFNSTLDHEKQFELLRLQNPSPDESADLDSIRHDLPLPIDYAIVVADESSPTAPVARAVASLDAGMRLIAQSPTPPFVRVYQRTGAH
jgi:hypothetical protein